MRIAVTGTDTDVGKTYVSAGILRQLTSDGISIVGCKPVESGVPTGEMGADANALADAAGRQAASLYRFPDPVSPHLAARRAGQTVSIQNISEMVDGLEKEHSNVLVEGAGGLLAPLSNTETIADLLLSLAAPVLLVSADRLGAINHTLLSVAHCQQVGLNLAGIVLNETQLGAATGLGNREAIQLFCDVPVVSMPFGGNAKRWQEVASLVQLLLSS